MNKQRYISLITSCIACMLTSVVFGQSYLNLPFYDEFAYQRTTPDTSLWIDSSGVFINNSISNAHPTWGMATFDGTDANGKPYDFLPFAPGSNIQINGITDVLTSKPIDLSLFTPTDSVGISFYWQRGGNDKNLLPDVEKGDSLRLYFLNKSGKWDKAWPVTPLESATQGDTTLSPLGKFHSKLVQITDTNYLYKGFQFKFETYGRTTGRWDVWSLDLVKVDTHITAPVNVIDLCFKPTQQSIYKGAYTQVPKDVFFASPSTYLNDQYSYTVELFSNSINFLKDSTIILKELVSNTILETAPTTITSNIFQPQESRTKTFQLNTSQVISGLNSISNKDSLLMELSFNFVNLDGKPKRIQYLAPISSALAYDDGSSEAAYGVRERAQLAVKFDLPVSDTLTGISLYFVKQGLNLNGVPLRFMVWKSLKGIDGATETELITTNLGTVTYTDAIDKFYTFQFAKGIILPAGTFYIGYEQNTEARILIGFDKSKNNADKIYTNHTGWKTAGETPPDLGTLMLRADFKNTNAASVLNPQTPQVTIDSSDIEPFIETNPVSTLLTIHGDIKEANIIDLTGYTRVSIPRGEYSNTTLDVSDLDEGIYIVHITAANGKWSKHRVVKTTTP